MPEDATREVKNAEKTMIEISAGLRRGRSVLGGAVGLEEEAGAKDPPGRNAIQNGPSNEDAKTVPGQQKKQNQRELLKKIAYICPGGDRFRS